MFYFRLRTKAGIEPFALVSLYSKADPEVFKLSFGTISCCEYRGEAALRVIPIKTIIAVVGMVPAPTIAGGLQNPNNNRFFVAEKMGLGTIHLADNSDIDLDDSDDEE